MSASTELISGLGAPARTANPIVDRARSTRLFAMTVPCLMSSSSAGAAMITTSAGSPRRSRLGIVSGELPIDPPYIVTILLPVERSNTGESSAKAAVNAPDISTRISGTSAQTAPNRTPAATSAVVTRLPPSVIVFRIATSGAVKVQFGAQRQTAFFEFCRCDRFMTT